MVISQFTLKPQLFLPVMYSFHLADVFDALAAAAPALFRRLGAYLQKAAGEIGYDLQERLETRRDQYRQ